MANACILLVAAYVATVSSALSAATNSQTGTWVNLFQGDPYHSGPDFMAGLSCNTDTSCYVFGDEVFSFSGVLNGTFTPIKMSSPPGLITAITVSGPTDAPGGAVVGLGGVNLNYPVNSVTFMPSTTPAGFGALHSQDARTSTNGQDVLVVNNGPVVVYSSNGGKAFNLKSINVPLATNCTTTNYGAIADKNTWYVIMGSSLSGSCNTPSVQIVKTTDGGNTWTTQLSQASNFIFNAIDCLSATHCVAVGEGDSGVYIYRTVDGQTWSQVFTKAPTSVVLRYSLTSLRASAHGTFFAAGFQQIQSSHIQPQMSYLLTSVDGGATWVEGSLPNVVEITGLSFTPGGYGFAIAVTIPQPSSATTPPSSIRRPPSTTPEPCLG